MVSHTDPSITSESPIRTQVRPGSPSSRMARAIPRPTGSPCPSDPVATSTHGISGTGAGWPWTGLPNLRKLMSSSSLSAPIALSTEYSSGDAWPFERMNRSLPRSLGSSTSNRRWSENSTASRWAADIEDVGCPDPAAVEHRMLSTLSWAASSFHSRVLSMTRPPWGSKVLRVFWRDCTASGGYPSPGLSWRVGRSASGLLRLRGSLAGGHLVALALVEGERFLQRRRGFVRLAGQPENLGLVGQGIAMDVHEVRPLGQRRGLLRQPEPDL